MNPGPPPPSPDDDASDPLLAALRQRLGDYGQAPPPAAWAAIRQRLPPAPVRPWWRRARRMLPLLALLLSFITIGLLTEQPTDLASNARRLRHQRPAAQPSAGQPLDKAKAADTSAFAAHEPLAAAATQPTAKPLAPAPAAATPPATTAAPHRKATLPTSFSKRPALAQEGFSGLPAPFSKQAASAGKGFLGHVSGLEKRSSTTQKPASSAHRFSGTNAASASAAASASKNRRHVPERVAFGAAPAAGRRHESGGYSGARPATPTARSLSASPALSPGAVAATLAAASAKTPAHLAYAAPKKRHADQTYSHPPALAAAAARATSRGRPALAGALAPTKTRPDRRRPRRAGTLAGAPAPTKTPGANPAAQPYLVPAAAAGAAVDSLARGRPVLVLAAGALPAALRATPDSVRPAALPVRRWSVLLVAGPTLSYRTLGPAPALAAGQPDFARLERPALGFGAQVQVRRVLSGRWALAVGLGYHEYATQLALSRKDSTSYTAIQQRDTYRLLTVPVQLSYALAAPRGRLSWALLAGFEPGWYQGGRSTEGSTCSCQQQPYSSAAASPYRPLSLSLSLGLAVRYRLGSAASRWQWLVQPTGRYVATPFVRSDAVGFTPRQPFSLGLLTGFSWDVR